MLNRKLKLKQPEPEEDDDPPPTHGGMWHIHPLLDTMLITNLLMWGQRQHGLAIGKLADSHVSAVKSTRLLLYLFIAMMIFYTGFEAFNNYKWGLLNDRINYLEKQLKEKQDGRTPSIWIDPSRDPRTGRLGGCGGV
jgi:hypothetical protein